MNGGETVLEKLHKKGITATDIATQFWCERQMELNNLHKPTPTSAMAQGARMHEVWQAKVYVPLGIEPRSYPDSLYKTAYENYMTLRKLKTEGIGRELMVYGSINGYRFTGKIDELKVKENKVVIVEDKTIRTGMPIDAENTKHHKVQIMLYRKMLEDLREGRYTYDNYSNVYRISDAKMTEEFLKGLREIGVKDEMLSVSAMYKTMFKELQSMPELSQDLEIRYVNRQSGQNAAELTVKYDTSLINEQLKHAMGYWRGERPSDPVPESERWKCKPCKFFGKECKVWWSGG